MVPVSFVGSPFLSGALRNTALVALRPDVAVAPHLEIEPLGERVHDRDADAVQSARNLVAPAIAELAAGVKHRQHDLGGGALLLLVHVDGMPRPLSETVTRLSGCRTISTESQ